MENKKIRMSVNNYVYDNLAIDNIVDEYKQLELDLNINLKSNYVNRKKDGATFPKPTEGDPIRDPKDLQDFLFALKTNSSKDRVLCARNYAIFMTGITTGLRVSDILKLKVRDVLTLDGKIKPNLHIVEQKTSKTNIIPKISNLLANALIEYLNLVGEIGLEFDYTDYLWVGHKAHDVIINEKPLSRKSIYKIFQNVANQIEMRVPTHVSTHTMRKTFGYYMYKKSTDKANTLIILQEWYNHSTPNITLSYIGITKEEKIKTFDVLDNFLSEVINE